MKVLILGASGITINLSWFREGSNPIDRFWSKVQKIPGGCWLWKGTRLKKKPGILEYGQFTIGPKAYYAHRLAHLLLVGPIADDLELDHTCRIPWCVNPDHLEPVLHAVNVRRGDVPARFGARTHCGNGHPFDDKNTALVDSSAKPGHSSGRYRRCRTCAAQTAQRWRNKQRAA